MSLSFRDHNRALSASDLETGRGRSSVQGELYLHRGKVSISRMHWASAHLSEPRGTGLGDKHRGTRVKASHLFPEILVASEHPWNQLKGWGAGPPWGIKGPWLALGTKVAPNAAGWPSKPECWSCSIQQEQLCMVALPVSFSTFSLPKQKRAVLWPHCFLLLQPLALPSTLLPNLDISVKLPRNVNQGWGSMHRSDFCPS